MVILQWLPLANLICLVGGGLYAIAVLKLSLKAYTDKLERIANLVDQHEHRLTRVETKLQLEDESNS